MSPSSYCWWKKSCTTWDVQNPKNNDRFSISTGAGFLPSTVSKSTRTGRWLMPSPQPSEGHHQVWRRRERHAQWSPTGLLHWWRSQGKRWCSPTCWLLETSPKSSCTFPSDSSSWCCGCYQYQRTSSMHPPASPYVRWHLHRCLAPLSNIKTSEEGTAVSTPISTSSIRPSSGCCGSMVPTAVVGRVFYSHTFYQNHGWWTPNSHWCIEQVVVLSKSVWCHAFAENFRKLSQTDFCEEVIQGHWYLEGYCLDLYEEYWSSTSAPCPLGRTWETQLHLSSQTLHSKLLLHIYIYIHIIPAPSKRVAVLKP